MTPTPDFEELLSLIEDRSAALRAEFAASPDPGVRVPSCPDWSLGDLVEHLTGVHRFWADTVEAGPAGRPPAEASAEAPADAPASADLLDRSVVATERLVAVLRSAGPAAGCWTWWGDADVPMTSGAVARHQVHEAAVHAFDAQLAAGAPQPVPASVALDGIDEFIGVGHGTAGPWPYEPVRIGLHTDEGRSWVVELTASGSRVVDSGPDGTDAGLRGPASDLLLTLHGRLPLDSLRGEGDRATLRTFLSRPDLD
ncbi:maleylpyruvate isomerase family mycothiol-dependent enzyme [Streptomyces fructofermentans]|uniref:maleylpyruvate isomerase family mycothiol-dependent enzyme n=1 Tax=Streptomyces fructofermentans TaxID=152141 RepID=UPI0033E71A52